MGRLIDADALLEDMKTFKDNCKSMGITPNWENANRIIKEQPTAYDVEAVVAELEKLKESVFGCDDTKCSKCKYKSQCFNVDKGHKVALDKAISIVRGKE